MVFWWFLGEQKLITITRLNSLNIKSGIWWRSLTLMQSPWEKPFRLYTKDGKTKTLKYLFHKIWLFFTAGHQFVSAHLETETLDYIISGQCSLSILSPLSFNFSGGNERKHWLKMDKTLSFKLAHFIPTFHFYTPRKRQKILSFLTFSGGIKTLDLT